jgi:hypothetical protein
MMFPDNSFPYCLDPMAMPMGSDDNNIVMRLRGYLNVKDTLGGKPATFVLKCDDGCQLFVGATHQPVMQANDDSPLLTGRRGRWVTFFEPGLYPVELIYFQNATSGYLEWSRADTSLFSGDDVAVDNRAWMMESASFKPVAGADLFSALIGTNPNCQECGAPGMDCSTGSYCGDGLCQACNVPDHCGATCMKCPADRNLCSAGKCVQCLGDDMCPSGSKCDSASGTCKMPTGCTSNAQCPPPNVCLPEGFCGEPPKCKTDTDCAGNVGCACMDGTSTCMQKVCIVPPSTCADDGECPSGTHCDAVAGLCRQNGDDHYLYEGGLVGCSLAVGGETARRDRAAGLLALLGFSLVLLARRRRISPAA